MQGFIGKKDLDKIPLTEYDMLRQDVRSWGSKGVDVVFFFLKKYWLFFLGGEDGELTCTVKEVVAQL